MYGQDMLKSMNFVRNQCRLWFTSSVEARQFKTILKGLLNWDAARKSYSQNRLQTMLSHCTTFKTTSCQVTVRDCPVAGRRKLYLTLDILSQVFLTTSDFTNPQWQFSFLTLETFQKAKCGSGNRLKRQSWHR